MILYFKKNGFTLLEVIIVMAIFAVLAVLSFPVYSNWQANANLATAENGLVENLKMAETNSLAGYENSHYGIFINSETKSYIYFQGDSYANRNADNDQITTLDNNYSISSDLPESEIVFSKDRVEPTATGTISITDGNTGKISQISINDVGFIDGSGD